MFTMSMHGLKKDHNMHKIVGDDKDKIAEIPKVKFANFVCSTFQNRKMLNLW